MAEPAKRPPALEEIRRPNDDPFRLGSRSQWISLPDGTRKKRLIPLTARDLLDPQVGDHVVQNSWHIKLAHVLMDLLEWRYEAHPDVLVSSDLKILWGIPGLENPAPDVVVIPGVRDREKYRPSFPVRNEGARPTLCIEVVSDDPKQRDNDYVEKVRIYQQAGVREYLILDPFDPPGALCWTGYRLGLDGRYLPIVPDAEGGIESETTGLWFGTDPDRRTLRILDAATGERLQTSSEARKGQQEAEERAQAAEKAQQDAEARAQEAEAELARLREEIRRLKG